MADSDSAHCVYYIHSASGLVRCATHDKDVGECSSAIGLMDEQIRVRALAIVALEKALVEVWKAEPSDVVWTAERAYRRGVEDAVLAIEAAKLRKGHDGDSDAMLIQLTEETYRVLREQGLMRQ